MWRLAFLLGCAAPIAFAEVFEFSNVPIPGGSSLDGYHVFPIYASAVGAKLNDKATVTFRNFEIKPDYPSVQIALIPWKHNKASIGNIFSCSTSSKQAVFNASGVPIFTPSKEFQWHKEATVPIETTGDYLLAATNCGTPGDATLLKGQVVVKQPHGYLPGNKIWTLHWWGWFTIVNAFLCIVWMIAVARHSSSLLYAQKVIGGIMVAACIEGAVQYFLHKDWNNSGPENMMLFNLAMVFYCMKYVFTLRLLMETASGSGLILAELAWGVTLKMDIACAVFFLMQWAWKLLISYKYRKMLDFNFIMTITVPGTLLWLFLFTWVYRKFNLLSTTLEGKMDHTPEIVSLVTNVRLVLVGSFLLATVVLLLQLADVRLASTPWDLQWVPYDAAPHTAYTLFLLAMMMLWRPRKDSWKLAYSDQVGQKEPGQEEEEQAQRVEAQTIGADGEQEER